MALSVMHDTAYGAEVVAFSKATSTDTFVIPSYAHIRPVEDAKPASLLSVSLPVLVQPSADTPILPPVSTEPRAEGHDMIAPLTQAVAVRPLPRAVKADVASVSFRATNPAQQIRSQAPKIVPQVSGSASQPVLRMTAVAPRYVIGVYR